MPGDHSVNAKDTPEAMLCSSSRSPLPRAVLSIEATR
jgi:hypothetical protein